MIAFVIWSKHQRFLGITGSQLPMLIGLMNMQPGQQREALRLFGVIVEFFYKKLFSIFKIIFSYKMFIADHISDTLQLSVIR
ncbi:hypothetical protein D3C75_671080 [compost metagenome]